MRRGAILLLLFFLILTVFLVTDRVSAQTCQPNDIILRLESPSNSHGEVYNGAGNYQVNICYSSIFGFMYPGLNPRTCSANNANAILRLSGNTNAHAEIKENSGYGNVICYGNLVCASIPGNVDCSTLGNNAKEVVSLSDSSNAHIEKNNTDSYTENMNRKICCGTGALSSSVYLAQWQDQHQQTLQESYVNRTVTAKAFAIGYSPGTSVNLRIWDDDNGNGAFDLGDDSIENIVLPLGADGTIKRDLFISDDVIEIGDGGESDCSSGGGLELYFNAAIGQDSETSGQLTVHCNVGENDPPTAKIKSPVHRQIYFANVPINFVAEGIDGEGDALNYTWSVVSNGVEEFSDVRKNFTHTFASDGMRTITLRVSETRENGGWDETQIAIAVISSPGMIAFINNPFHQEIVEKQRADNFKISFSATDSYVINSVGGACSMTITCLGGNCPPNTFIPPPSCSSNISVQSTPQPFTSLNFKWSFYKGTQIFDTKEGLGLSQVVVDFLARSDARNDRKAKLELSYTGVVTESETTERVFTDGQCINGGASFILTDGNGKYVREYDTNTAFGCSGGDNVAGNGNDCCPVQASCSVDAQSPGCFFTTMDSCDDYTNEDACENDENTFRLFENDPARSGLQCRNDVECYWEDHGNSNPNDDSCGLRASCGDGGGEGSCRPLTCEYTYTQTECLNRFTTITFTVESFDGDCEEYTIEDCGVREEVIAPCDRFSFELPAFGLNQGILSLTLISIIYFIIFYRRN